MRRVIVQLLLAFRAPVYVLCTISFVLGIFIFGVNVLLHTHDKIDTVIGFFMMPVGYLIPKLYDDLIHVVEGKN